LVVGKVKRKAAISLSGEKMLGFVAYIISKFLIEMERKIQEREGSEREVTEILYGELQRIVFEELPREQRLALFDSEEEFKAALKALSECGIIEYDEKRNVVKIRDRRALERIAKLISGSPFRHEVKLYDEYVRRIDRAVEATVK